MFMTNGYVLEYAFLAPNMALLTNGYDGGDLYFMFNS